MKNATEFTRVVILCLACLFAAGGAGPADAADHFSTDWTGYVEATSTTTGLGVAKDSLGNLYVTGSKFGKIAGGPYSGGGDIFLAKFSPDGRFLWDASLGNSGSDIPYGIAIDRTDGIFITGNATQNNSVYRALVARYRTDGSRAWIRYLSSNANDRAVDIDIDPAGRLVICGWTDGDISGAGSNGGRDAFLAKYRADGTLEWVKQFGGPGSDYLDCIVTDASSNIYAAGRISGVMHLMLFDPDGNMLWDRECDLAGNPDVPTVIESGPDGNIYVGGYYIAAGAGNVRFLEKFDVDGNGVWLYTADGSAEGGDASTVSGMGFDCAGNVLLAGDLYSSGVRDVLLEKVGADGTGLWATSFGSLQDENARDMLVEGDNAFITGMTRGALSGPDEPRSSPTCFLVKLVLDREGAPDAMVSAPACGELISGTAYCVTGSVVDGCEIGTMYVEVSTDGGTSWSDANDTSGDGTWSTWGYRVDPAEPGTHEILARVAGMNGELGPNSVPVVVTVEDPVVCGEGTAGVRVPRDGGVIAGNYTNLIASTRGDVSGVLFQYRAAGVEEWTDAVPASSGQTNPSTKRPYKMKWGIADLPGGTYELRAVCIDSAGNMDCDPAVITVRLNRPVKGPKVSPSSGSSGAASGRASNGKSASRSNRRSWR